MKIVLVHGIFNTGRIFFLLRRRLEQKGIECITPSLEPFDGRFGLDDLGKKLRDYINIKLGESGYFVLLGFSMGGIISRYYLQHLDGAKRVKHFISISTPHHGSYLAYFHPGKGTKQLRPKSSFLESLKESEYLLDGIKLYSYWTPFDLSIIPAASSVWEIAESKKFYSLFHPLMLFNKKIVNEIVVNILANS